MALEMKTSCEKCAANTQNSAKTFICSFECTFCAACAETVFKGACPNCGGEFVKRPIRPAGKLEKYQPSAARVRKDHAGCRKAA